MSVDFVSIAKWFNIPISGECSICDAKLFNVARQPFCAIYGKVIDGQLSECKAALTIEICDLRCSKCVHLGDYPDWGCEIGSTGDSISCKDFKSERP